MKSVLTLTLIAPLVLSGCAKEGAPSSPQSVEIDSGISSVRRCQGDECKSDRQRNAEMQCNAYSEEMDMEGVWVIAFEASRFYEGASTYSDIAPIEELEPKDWRKILTDYTWLSFEGDAGAHLPKLKLGYREEMQRYPSFAYRMEVKGRRSICDGTFGHMGLAKHEVIVSKILNIEEITYGEE